MMLNHTFCSSVINYHGKIFPLISFGAFHLAAYDKCYNKYLTYFSVLYFPCSLNIEPFCKIQIVQESKI